MTILSSSELYCMGAHVAPEAYGVVDADSHCAMCGVALPAGTAANPITKNTFDSAFNNRADLRATTGRFVCGHCMPLWSKDWMQKYSKTFATTENVYKFASNDQQAAFLLNPPPTPFCAIFSTKQQQHMIWRTPLSLSREMYTVRVDGDLLLIRQSVLMEGFRAFRHAESVMANTPLASTGRKLKPPAALFSRELARHDMGSLREDVQQLMRQSGNDWVINALHSMSMAEWWALNVIRHYDPDNPPAWQPALEEGSEPESGGD